MVVIQFLAGRVLELQGAKRRSMEAAPDVKEITEKAKARAEVWAADRVSF